MYNLINSQDSTVGCPISYRETETGTSVSVI